MRPLGEISRAALRSAWDVAVERAKQPVPGATVRDLEARLVPAGIGRTALRNTVKNLARLGHLRPVGQVRVVGSSRSMVAYAPALCAPDVRTHHDAGAALASITRAWVG